jgi:hypothetical protein
MATAADVRVGVNGSVYVAPAATALTGDTATDPTTASFTDLGYVSEDGVAQTIDRSTSDIKAWGGDVVRTIQTEHSVSYTFTLIETSAEVVQLYYNDPDATATLAEITGAQAGRHAFIIDVLDGSKKIRLEIPDGEITDTGDVTYATEEAIGYEMTITCYPDSNGVKVFKRMLLA